MMAFILSPRPLRHPYLVYTSLIIVASRVAVTDFVAPYIMSFEPASASSSGPASTPAARRQQQQQKKKDRARARARARMESSYEMLGPDEHSEGEGEGDEADFEHEVGGGELNAVNNGEEVRAKVEVFLKKQVVQGVVAGLGFLMAVVGIWGDAVAPVVTRGIVIEV